MSGFISRAVARAEREDSLSNLLDDLDRELGANDLVVMVPVGVVAQAWRGGPRQARVARLLADPGVDILALDEVTARAVGLLSGRSGHPDVVAARHCRVNSVSAPA